MISTGNGAVCDASDWLGARWRAGRGRARWRCSSSPTATARSSPRRWRCCAERGIGVAVLKVGSSEAGAGAAAAHTGALAGDQRVFRSLIEEAGGAWARDPHELLELARVLAEPRARPRGDGGLAILTCSGGDSGIAADEAERLGIELPPLSERDPHEARASCCPTRRRSATRSTTPRCSGPRRSSCARSSPPSAPTPRSTSCSSSTTPPGISPTEATDGLGGDPRRPRRRRPAMRPPRRSSPRPSPT